MTSISVTGKALREVRRSVERWEAEVEGYSAAALIAVSDSCR